MRWLDPASQARLKALSLSPRRAWGAAASAGKHRTMVRGHSRDFAQHRPYAPGDEVRGIDWKAYARLDRFFVREFRAEDRIPVFILLDCSGSMAYGGPGRSTKFDVARRLAAGAAWIALSQGDEVGLVSFSTSARKVLASRAGAGQLPALDEALTGLQTGGETDLAGAIGAAADVLPRKGLCVLLSDLMGETAATLKAARSLVARRHELLVVRTLDSDEREFPYEGLCLVDGLEGGPQLFLNAGEAAPEYRAAFARQAAVLEGSFRRAGVAYTVAETDGSWESALGRLLARS
ncbi:MAG: DUF58 domain-containing protein [Elusimicrobiota bacterium]|mgnify:CR=1 FL=1